MDWSFVLPDGFLGLGCGLLTLAPALIKDVKKERTEFDFDKQVQCIVGMLVVFAILLESHKFIENIYFKNVRVILIMVFVMQLVYRGGWCYDYLKEKRALTIKDVSMVSSAFQAEVTEIGSGRLFVKNIFIKVEDEWFPYSYPTAQRNEFLTLYLRSYSEKRKIRKGDAISFEAVGDITVERTGNNTKVWVGGLLDGHDLKHLEKLETSDIPKEKLLDIWYKAERTYCDCCIYSMICKERSLPCIIVSDTNGGWAREEIKKCYPKLIDEVTEKLRDQISFSGCFGGIIKWYEDEAAKAVGFEKACAIIFCTPDGPLQAGSRICAIGGDPIDSEEALNKVLELEKNRTLGRMVTVETQAPNQKPITKLITLEDPRKVAEYLITQMPYAGEKEKDGWIYN